METFQAQRGAGERLAVANELALHHAGQTDPSASRTTNIPLLLVAQRALARTFGTTEVRDGLERTHTPPPKDLAKNQSTITGRASHRTSKPTTIPVQTTMIANFTTNMTSRITRLMARPLFV